MQRVVLKGSMGYPARKYTPAPAHIWTLDPTLAAAFARASPNEVMSNLMSNIVHDYMSYEGGVPASRPGENRGERSQDVNLCHGLMDEPEPPSRGHHIRIRHRQMQMRR